jgi:hypothetical protein
MTGNSRAFLSDLFRTAVDAAHPATCLPLLQPCRLGVGALDVEVRRREAL